MSSRQQRIVEEYLHQAPRSVGAYSRRQFAKYLSFGAAMIAGSGAFADELLKTPALTEGPFYPDKLPLDTDNDLLMINQGITPAVGEITHLSGRVLTENGSPVRNAFVEIWQVDNNGSYLHTGSNNRNKLDANFQGYGRFLTDSKGQYYFRTIKPVPYPGRTPHIHFAVSQNGQRVLTTQLLIKGHEGNEKDGVFRALKSPEQRDLLLASFDPMQGSKLGELTAGFDMVIGKTPNESEEGKIRGGLGKPLGR